MSKRLISLAELRRIVRLMAEADTTVQEFDITDDERDRGGPLWGSPERMRRSSTMQKASDVERTLKARKVQSKDAIDRVQTMDPVDVLRKTPDELADVVEKD